MSSVSKTFWTDRAKTKIDTKTGMPEVPEGFFWKIEEWNKAADKISLMEEIKVPRSKAWASFVGLFGVRLGAKYRNIQREKSFIDMDGITSDKEYKVSAIENAHYILYCINKDEDKALVRTEVVSQIRKEHYGAYPPRNL